MNKLFSNGRIEVPVIPPIVSVSVPDPDTLANEYSYPYFGEIYQDADSIKKIVKLNTTDDSIYDAIRMRLMGFRYRYPITSDGQKVGSGLQDKAFVSTIAANRQKIDMLEYVWTDRVQRLESYLNDGYESNTISKIKSDGTDTNESTATNKDTTASTRKEDSINTSDSTSKDKNDTKHNDQTSSDSSGNSNSKDTVFNYDLPERNNIVFPGGPGDTGIGTDFVSTATASENNSTNTGTNSSQSNGDINVTGESERKDNSNSNLTGESNTTSDGNYKNNSKNISNNNIDTDTKVTGRNRDLIALSEELQNLSERESLVNYISRILEAELSAYVSSFTISRFFTVQTDSFTGRQVGGR